MSYSIYQLKPHFQELLRPSMTALALTGITPNQVTLGAMALSVAYGTALITWTDSVVLWYCMPLVLLARMALNAVDGMLANATDNTTPIGALLNEFCDQVSDAALYLPFALATGTSALLAVIVVFAGLLAEFAGVLTQSIGVPRRFDGPMGKSDRAFAFGLLALLTASGAAAAWKNGMLVLMLLLSLLTVFNRLRQALRLCAPMTR
ncbi:CDP-alcohol phosphatidyltransferase family protein [Massilia sp. H6]|uniref:CDP-alcohol phosphatidyltransferase family protein n=1 Tax=Massilia sp. H6 TaxID=2970464 RepID=UPI00216A917E|nr:CDP-alcohol phosphatidyltransferase family protein [Massilia sp. H6]UVW27251.1 CDP-alcohol phosphatidyltransferase family protein [Massilia sp. H6]